MYLIYTLYRECKNKINNNIHKTKATVMLHFKINYALNMSF